MCASHPSPPQSRGLQGWKARGRARSGPCCGRRRSRRARSAPTPAGCGNPDGHRGALSRDRRTADPAGGKRRKKDGFKKEESRDTLPSQNRLGFLECPGAHFYFMLIKLGLIHIPTIQFFFFLRNYSGGRNCIYLSLTIYNPRRGAYASKPQGISSTKWAHVPHSIVLTTELHNVCEALFYSS